MNNVRLRLATIYDVSILSNYQRHLALYEGHDLKSPAVSGAVVSNEIYNLIKSKQGYAYISYEGDLPTGCVIVTVGEDKDGSFAEAGGLWVEPGSERRTAILLMRQAAIELKSWKVDRVMITTTTRGSRGDRSRLIHKAMGFKPKYTVHEASLSDVINALDQRKGN